MANLNENLEKVKSVVEDTAKKAQESEAFNKVKATASDVTQKIKDNETVANAVDKINQNEYVAKVNKSKYAKFIKIGAVVVAVVLIFNLIGWVFGDKNAKKAQEALEAEIVYSFQEEGYSNIKVKSTAIGKNEDSCLYAFDTKTNFTFTSGVYEATSYIIMYSDGENSYVVKQYEYEDYDKNDMKEIALAMLAKG